MSHLRKRSGRRLLTPVEAAVQLGVTAATVRRWLASGELDGVCVVGRLRVDPEALDALIRAVGPDEEQR